MSVRVLVGFEDGLRPGLRRRIPGGASGAERLVRRAAHAAFEAEATPDGEVSITLMSDAGIADLNQRYLAHDGPTDVLAFPLHEPGASPIGDVYLGIDQALRQAADLGIDPREEVARLAIHGTLHVLGHDHPEGAYRTRSAMWRLQEGIVAGVMRERSTTGARPGPGRGRVTGRRTVRSTGRGTTRGAGGAEIGS